MTEKIFRRNDLRVSLDAAALLHNVELLRSCCKDTVKFCAVVKANAYGHGLSSVVDILAQAQVDCFAVASVYTHFANADEEDLSFAREQLDLFNGVLKKQKGYIHDGVMIHAANSPATMKLPEAHFDMVRCGISMYGYSTISTPPVELRPVLKLTAPIIHINTVQKGQTVGYGRTFTAKRITKIGILPIGYSDGFWRFFSNQAKLIVENKIVPVIGRVTMNQTILDITDVPNVQLGQSVTLIDEKFDSPCGVYALAKSSGTICNEILTNIPIWASVSQSGKPRAL